MISLITENGCEVLSENLMRDPDQIEAFMQEKVKNDIGRCQKTKPKEKDLVR